MKKRIILREDQRDEYEQTEIKLDRDRYEWTEIDKYKQTWESNKQVRKCTDLDRVQSTDDGVCIQESRWHTGVTKNPIQIKRRRRRLKLTVKMKIQVTM